MPDMSGERLRRVNRAARDPVTGKSITVPGDMTYQQWYAKYVAGNPQAKANENMVQNRAADRAQLERYRAVLGDRVPKNLAEFQRIKYNEPEKWKFVQLDYSRRQELIRHPETALPSAESAVAPEPKFTRYLFGGTHEDGLAKGRAFSSRLGYDADNWNELRSEIIQSAPHYPAVFKRNNGYSDLYEQKIVLYGKNINPLMSLLDGQTFQTEELA